MTEDRLNADAPAFDPARLDRQAMGNEALRVEILALFITEAERLLSQTVEARDPRVRAERLHALAGLARNVGAERLALVARRLQRDVLDPAFSDAGLSALVAAVGQAVDAVLAETP